MMQMILDGRTFDISTPFGACVRAVLGTLEFQRAHVETARQALMAASNARDLTLRERERLEYLTHVGNVANAIAVVGAHHDPVAEWGLDGWDAVHGQGTTHSCGCQTHEVVDHHAFVNHFGHERVTGESARHLVEPRRVCAAHEHLRHDVVAHKAALG